MIDIIIEEKAALFVSAVGVPPRWAVEKLHAANIPVNIYNILFKYILLVIL